MTDHETEHRKALGEAYRERFAASVLAAVGVTDADPYFRDCAPCYSEGASSGKAWCGICVLSVARSVGLTDWLWRDGDGFLRRLKFKREWDQVTTRPKVGDVCYINSPFRHHCVVVSVDLDAGTCETVGGNEGMPSAVRGPTTRKIKNKRLSFFAIRKWVDAAIDRDLADTVPPPPGPDTSPAPPPFPVEP